MLYTIAQVAALLLSRVAWAFLKLLVSVRVHWMSTLTFAPDLLSLTVCLEKLTARYRPIERVAHHLC